MKAYEFKVTLKGSRKPPIWRTFIIPSNVTFSQLHNTIQIVMGWYDCHLHEFQFSDALITNNEEACDEYKYFNSKEGKKRLKELGLSFDAVCPNDNMPVLNSVDVKIGKYVENSPAFKYIYDFGDWWEHKVEFKQIIKDYDKDYPMVLKWKGYCPPEDCGGIEGYYELLNVLNDPENENHAEMLEWSRMQMYSEEYDVDYVNELLETALDYEPIAWE